MMEDLKPKEKQILNFLNDFTKSYGYPPSVRDIAAGVGIKSTSTVHSYIKSLNDKGIINKTSGRSRGLRPTDNRPEEKSHASIPLIGKVTAGQPILAVENIEGYLDFPLLKRSYRENPSSLFALRVSGESMIEAGIMDGDIVVVQKSPGAEDGEIVVALLEDSATVKEFHHEGDKIRLQPRNPSMEPIITDDLTIIGKVVSVMRFYN
ncbi:MAG: transcriptional repressor LexA [Clostridia bacterium]|nr:transcriptional repressor LexA [Clostridia bacterium]